MNLDTEFISAMCAWCREHEIVWEYSSLTMTHYFIKMPSDPIERSLQECFGKSFPTCCVSHHLMKVNSGTFDQGNSNILSLTDLILFRIRADEDGFL